MRLKHELDGEKGRKECRSLRKANNRRGVAIYMYTLSNNTLLHPVFRYLYRTLVLKCTCCAQCINNYNCCTPIKSTLMYPKD